MRPQHMCNYLEMIESFRITVVNKRDEVTNVSAGKCTRHVSLPYNVR